MPTLNLDPLTENILDGGERFCSCTDPRPKQSRHGLYCNRCKREI